MKAVFNGKVIAESDDTVVVEGSHYFHQNAVSKKYLEDSDMKTTCPWKGEASYFDVVVDGERVENGAWYYPGPKPEAKKIKGHLSFWKGVEVKE